MSDNTNTRIGDLMRERNLKPFPFSKEIGVKSSTMTSIYKGEVNFENIRIDTFIRIAHGLGMTADELFYGEIPAEQPITTGEQKMLDVYRSATNHGRCLIDAVIDGEARHVDEQAKNEEKSA